MIFVVAATIITGLSDARATICVLPEGCDGVLNYLANPPDYHRYGPFYCRKLLVRGIWTRVCWRLDQPEPPHW